MHRTRRLPFGRELGPDAEVGKEPPVAEEVDRRAFLGEDGRVIGLDRFGASAPYKVLYEHFEITVENVVQQVRALMR